jgi:hypothetical protein
MIKLTCRSMSHYIEAHHDVLCHCIYVPGGAAYRDCLDSVPKRDGAQVLFSLADPIKGCFLPGAVVDLVGANLPSLRLFIQGHLREDIKTGDGLIFLITPREMNAGAVFSDIRECFHGAVRAAEKEKIIQEAKEKLFGSEIVQTAKEALDRPDSGQWKPLDPPRVMDDYWGGLTIDTETGLPTLDSFYLQPGTALLTLKGKQLIVGDILDDCTDGYDSKAEDIVIGYRRLA